MIKLIGAAFAIAALVAGGPTSCGDKEGLNKQDTSVQDLETFPKCDDNQGHGAVHPCTSRKDDGKWIIWVTGVDQVDCPAYTVQAKDDVLCLNATGS
jgi:hypothetical protein